MGLIKSIKKRIKRYNERRADCKFKKDLENEIETCFCRNPLVLWSGRRIIWYYLDFNL